MAVPPTPKPTRKAETLARAPTLAFAFFFHSYFFCFLLFIKAQEST
jgi:hypothetical protein